MLEVWRSSKAALSSSLRSPDADGELSRAPTAAGPELRLGRGGEVEGGDHWCRLRSRGLAGLGSTRGEGAARGTTSSWLPITTPLSVKPPLHQCRLPHPLPSFPAPFPFLALPLPPPLSPLPLPPSSSFSSSPLSSLSSPLSPLSPLTLSLSLPLSPLLPSPLPLSPLSLRPLSLPSSLSSPPSLSPLSPPFFTHLALRIPQYTTLTVFSLDRRRRLGCTRLPFVSSTLNKPLGFVRVSLPSPTVVDSPLCRRRRLHPLCFHGGVLLLFTLEYSYWTRMRDYDRA